MQSEKDNGQELQGKTMSFSILEADPVRPFESPLEALWNISQALNRERNLQWLLQN